MEVITEMFKASDPVLFQIAKSAKGKPFIKDGSMYILADWEKRGDMVEVSLIKTGVINERE